MGLAVTWASLVLMGGALLSLTGCTYPYWVRMQIAPESETIGAAEVERATRALGEVAVEVGLKAIPLDDAAPGADAYAGKPFRMVSAWRAWYEVPPIEGRTSTVTMALFVKSDASELRVVIRDEQNSEETSATRRIREAASEKLRATFPSRVRVSTGVDPPDLFAP